MSDASYWYLLRQRDVLLTRENKIGVLTIWLRVLEGEISENFPALIQSFSPMNMWLFQRSNIVMHYYSIVIGIIVLALHLLHRNTTFFFAHSCSCSSFVLLRRTGSRFEYINEFPYVIVLILLDAANRMPSKEIHHWMKEAIVFRCEILLGLPRKSNIIRIPTQSSLLTSRRVTRFHDYPDSEDNKLVPSVESRFSVWESRKSIQACRMHHTDICFGRETYSWRERQLWEIFWSHTII